MATHSSILAWAIPSTEEPGGLQSTGLQMSLNNTTTISQQQYTQNILPMYAETFQPKYSF